MAILLVLIVLAIIAIVLMAGGSIILVAGLVSIVTCALDCLFGFGLIRLGRRIFGKKKKEKKEDKA